jgi:hypothetical protein
MKIADPIESQLPLPLRHWRVADQKRVEDDESDIVFSESSEGEESGVLIQGVRAVGPRA